MKMFLLLLNELNQLNLYIMNKIVLFLFVFIALVACNTNQKPANLLQELDAQYTIFANETDVPDKVARSYTDSEGYKMVTLRDWTCGFPPGSMWQMYELTGDQTWKDRAIKSTMKLDGQDSAEADGDEE